MVYVSLIVSRKQNPIADSQKVKKKGGGHQNILPWKVTNSKKQQKERKKSHSGTIKQPENNWKMALRSSCISIIILNVSRLNSSVKGIESQDEQEKTLCMEPKEMLNKQNNLDQD